MADLKDIQYVQEDASQHLSEALERAEGLIELAKEYNEQEGGPAVELDPYEQFAGRIEQALNALPMEY